MSVSDVRQRDLCPSNALLLVKQRSWTRLEVGTVAMGESGDCGWKPSTRSPHLPMLPTTHSIDQHSLLRKSTKCVQDVISRVSTSTVVFHEHSQIIRE
uniref:Uncharacterized protein n=1 Tax=Mesocestoides corti TaxID=53468 RepID=A0A5K3FXP4_MESCO